MAGRGGKRKKLGQHFLVDTAVADRIVALSGVTKGDVALEIGPGKGILTGRLVRTGAVIRAVELDTALCDELQREMSGEKTLTVERCNALYFDYASMPTPFHVVGNLPYSVAVALIKKFLERPDTIVSMTLMTQREVAHRLTAGAGEPGYGSLSLYVAYHCKTEYLFDVPPEAFIPRPRVESAVIKLYPLGKPPVGVSDVEQFFRFIRASFGHRRKTLKNNLKGWWSSADQFYDACADADVNPKMRPQDVSMKSFADLFRRWEQTGSESGRRQPVERLSEDIER